MKIFGITDRGSVREENQDCFRFESTEDGVITAVLCDGMGGAQAGSIASAIAADAFMSHAANSLDPKSSIRDMREILTDAVRYANIKVYDRSYSDFACLGMGTTLVGLIMTPKFTAVANVGDSRAYLLEEAKLTQITQDHSLVAEMVAKHEITKEEARTHRKKNVITRAVGVEATVRCDIFPVKLRPQVRSRIILCSDGLSNMLTDKEIQDIAWPEATPEGCCRSLLDEALKRKAGDNVTVVVADR